VAYVFKFVGLVLFLKAELRPFGSMKKAWIYTEIWLTGFFLLFSPGICQNLSP